MRKYILAAASCLFLSSSFMVYAADAQKMDESTNPNTNTDMKTQNMQQKPNDDAPTNNDAKKRNHQKKVKTVHDHQSNVDPSSDEMASPTGSNTDKLQQKPQ